MNPLNIMLTLLALILTAFLLYILFSEDHVRPEK